DHDRRAAHRRVCLQVVPHCRGVPAGELLRDRRVVGLHQPECGLLPADRVSRLFTSRARAATARARRGPVADGGCTDPDGAAVAAVLRLQRTGTGTRIHVGGRQAMTTAPRPRDGDAAQVHWLYRPGAKRVFWTAALVL